MAEKACELGVRGNYPFAKNAALRSLAKVVIQADNAWGGRLMEQGREHPFHIDLDSRDTATILISPLFCLQIIIFFIIITISKSYGSK